MSSQYLGAFKWPGNINGTDPFSSGGRLSVTRDSQHVVIASRLGQWAKASLTFQAVGNYQIRSLPVMEELGPVQPGPSSYPEGCGFSGVLVDGDNAIFSAFNSYDGGNTQRVGHYINGEWRTLVDPMLQGEVAGYMCWVPERWRRDLGDIIVGQAGVSIVSRASYGPAAFAVGFDGYWSQPLCRYPHEFRLGDYESNNELFNQTMQIKGIGIAGDELIFGGTIGLGDPCYGEGTSDPDMHNVVINNHRYCYDPEHASKANHGYPYRYQVWIYKIPELLANAGTPWTVRPRVEELPIPRFHTDNGMELIQATEAAGFAVIDHGSGRAMLVVNQHQGETALNGGGRVGEYPIAHLLNYTSVAPSPTPGPEPEPEPEPVPTPEIERRVHNLEESVRAHDAAWARLIEAVQR